MNAPTVILICVIAVAFVAVVAVGIRNKLKGKHSCSCGGNCGACSACHPAEKDEK